MPSLKLNSEDFGQSLNPQGIKGLQLITLAFLIGIVSFLMVVLFLTLNRSTPPTPKPTEEQEALIFIGANLFLLFSCVMTGFILPKLQTRRSSFGDATSLKEGGVYRKAEGLYRLSFILRSSMFEAPALFGIVNIFLLGSNGVLQKTPQFWGVLAIPALCLLLIASGFPTRTRIESWFEMKIIPLFQEI